MWVSKSKYDNLKKENEKLKAEVNWFLNMYGEMVEDAYDEEYHFCSVHRCRMIHPALKRLLLSGFNGLLDAVGSDKKFKITDYRYTR